MSVVIVLRGCHLYRPDRRNSKCLYIMWNISHPEMVTPEEYELYDVVCICSRRYAEEIAPKVKVPVLPFCSVRIRNFFILLKNSRKLLRMIIFL